jgi:2-polyprenyl-3-methyl-5-hydroxy-6-metoxy-1,4-benzoquinol methylase
MDLDDPRTTHLRRRILAGKPFLRRIYEEWYLAIAEALPEGKEPVLELGSGAGFLADFVPGLVRSEVFYTPGIDAVLDGLDLPFREGSLRGIAMTNVLHHLPRPRRFFEEAARAVRPGGAVVMIEPWVSPWSRLVYTKLHHEPFLPEAAEWEVPSGGPLSGANGALPWILFERDRQRFESELPEWEIRSVEPFMPFRYLVSGGVSLRSFVPGWSFGLFRGAERALSPWRNRLAMFGRVVLVRKASARDPQTAWSDAVRRRKGMAPGDRFEDLEEPRRTWALYTLSTVERGRGVVSALQAHGWRPGVRFLDAGCAYGGYLVAAAEAGAAEVVGIDVDEDYLSLARELLAAYGVNGHLELGSVDDPELLGRLAGPTGFDVATCTDVLEHVADAGATLELLARSLAPGGRLYIAVPNFRCPAWVRSDPHYQIAGITLLPPDEARATAYAVHPWLPRYGVGEYHPLAWYRQRLADLGIDTWLLNPPAGTLAEAAQRLRREAVEIREEVERAPDARLPEDLARAVREAVVAWSEELLASVSLENPDPAILDEYGVQTWELLAIKPSG